MRISDWSSDVCSSDLFGHFFMALEAARRCSGVALAPTLFIDHMESHQELVRPFPSTIKSAGEYYFLCREASANDKDVRLFRKWLLAQGDEHRSPQPGHPPAIGRASCRERVCQYV